MTRFSSGDGRWEVSRGGGNWQMWSRDGREIFYIAPGGDLMSVSVEVGRRRLTLGVPRRLCNKGRRRQSFGVAPDGERFLFHAPVGDFDPTEIRVAQDWSLEF